MIAVDVSNKCYLKVGSANVGAMIFSRRTPLRAEIANSAVTQYLILNENVDINEIGYYQQRDYSFNVDTTPLLNFQ